MVVKLLSMRRKLRVLRSVVEDDVLSTCRALGVGLVPFSPLGRGFLTGQLTSPASFDANDFRRHSPRFEGENFERNQ
jgi:aryl-alcohol dehydrogenase-like predicted oxidoreductase